MINTITKVPLHFTHLSYSIQRTFTKQLTKNPTHKPSAVEKIVRLVDDENVQVHELESEMGRLSLKDFSLLSHKMLVEKNRDPLVWKSIQKHFLERFEFTSDREEIRSFGKIVYSLGKSPVWRSNQNPSPLSLPNYETKLSPMLPFSSHQTFTMITTTLSRMGPLSHQFTHIIQMLYYKRYQEFNVRERVQINYVLARNGREVDRQLLDFIDAMNFREIVLALRCFQQSNQLTGAIFVKCEKHLLARKSQINVIDLGDLCYLYFGAVVHDDLELSPEIEQMLMESYQLLKKNVNEIAFQKIWYFLPEVVNKGFLKINCIQNIIKTLQVLRRKELFSERIWKNIRKNFSKFDNTEIKNKLSKIL